MEADYFRMLCADLRDKLIPVGRLDGCTDMDKLDYDGLSNAINAYAASSQAFEARTADKVEGLREDIHEIKAGIKELNDSHAKIWAKLTNGITETQVRHEMEIKDRATQKELAGALNSLRREMIGIRWFVGALVGLTLAIVGVMGGALFL